MMGKNLQNYLENRAKTDPGMPERLRRMRVYFGVALQLASTRKKRGLTQSALAKKLKTTQPNIARWETPGYTRYSISRLIDIAEALDVTLDIRFLERVDRTDYQGWPDGKTAMKQILIKCDVKKKNDAVSEKGFSNGSQINTELEVSYAS